MLLSLIPTFLDACINASIPPIRPRCSHLWIPCLAPHIRDADCVQARCPHRLSCSLCTSSNLSLTFTQDLKKCVGLFLWDFIPPLISFAIFLVFQNWSLVALWQDWHENWYCKNQVDKFGERVEEVWSCILELKTIRAGSGKREREEALKRIERANERMVDFYIGVRGALEYGARYADVVRCPDFRAYYSRWSLVCVERARELAAVEHREKVEGWMEELRGDKPTRVEEMLSSTLSIQDAAGLSAERKEKCSKTLLVEADALYSKCEFTSAEELYTKSMGLLEKVGGEAGPSLTYLKALTRRARAREALGKLEDAFQGYTAAAALSDSQDLSLAMSIERVLAPLVKKDVRTLMKGQEETLPSLGRVSAMLKTCRLGAPPLPDTPSPGDLTLDLAFRALGTENYPDSLSLVNEALGQDISCNGGIASALTLRGAFRLLCGSISSAQADLHSATLFSAETSPAASVMLALTYLARGDPLSALGRLDEALRHHPHSVEVHYHRGLILLGHSDEFNEAVGAFRSCLAILRGSGGEGSAFLLELATAQLGAALYRAGESQTAFEVLSDAEKDYPESADVLISHAECLRHEERFEEALVKCEKAITIEKRKQYPNALCLVIKASIIDQWAQDVSNAEACFLEALGLDPEYTVALETLAQSYLRWGMREKAIEVRTRQAKVVREERQLARAVRERYILESRVHFERAFPASVSVEPLESAST